MTVLALAALLLSGQAAPPARSASDLTRDLNSAPPGAMAAPAPVRPAEPDADVQAPAPAPRATPPRAAAPAAVAAPTRPSASLTRDLNSAPPAAITAAPTAAQNRQSATEPTTGPAAAPAPVAAPAPAATSEAPVTRPAPAAANPADAAAALPFRIDLPAGFTIEPSDAGPQAKVYAVKRDGRSFVMIYQGPASHFPIYDGQLIDAGGRASVVIEQDGRRRAVEHLFAKDLESRETHVWLSYLDGEDSLLAEQIAQSVEPR